MKRHPAVAILDFSDIPTGVHATDAMVKKAPIALLRCGTVTDGRFLTIIGGSTASVAEALEEGLFWGGGSVTDHVFLADVDAQLFDGMFGVRQPGGPGAMAVITTSSVAAIARAVEAALKGTPVSLVEIRLADSGLAGKGLAVLRGELHDVEAAVGLALATVGPRHTVSHRIISSPHDATAETVDTATLFSAAATIELEGEDG
jgi:microcompartment protein CcmL/EutN